MLVSTTAADLVRNNFINERWQWIQVTVNRAQANGTILRRITIPANTWHETSWGPPVHMRTVQLCKRSHLKIWKKTDILSDQNCTWKLSRWQNIGPRPNTDSETTIVSVCPEQGSNMRTMHYNVHQTVYKLFLLTFTRISKYNNSFFTDRH